jgi:hypothetical protein
MRILLTTAVLLVSCSYSVTNDYIDFLKVNGISYIGVDYFGGGVLLRGIYVVGAFRSAMQELVAAAPTPESSR